MSLRAGGSNRDETDPAWRRVDDETESAGGGLAHPGRSPLLVSFVACVSVALGYDAGLTGPVTLVVAGALGVVGGCSLLGSRSARPRVLGSTILAIGLLFVTLAILVGASGVERGLAASVGAESARTVATLLAIGCGIGGIGYAVLVDWGGWVALSEALRDSTIAAILATPILLIVLDGRAQALLVAGGQALVDGSTASPAIALLSLQLLFLCVLVASATAAPAIERCTPNRVSIPTGGEMSDRVRSWPTNRYWLLAGYAVLWLVPGVFSAIHSALGSLGVIGVVVGTLLQSGILHGVLGGLTVTFLAIGLGYALFSPIHRWLEPNPVGTLSVAAGGVLVPLAVLVGGTAGSDQSLLRLGALGLFPLVVVTPLGWVVTRAIAHFEPSRSHLVGIAATTLLAATLGLAPALSSIGVLIGVATALLAWELGSHALSIHRATGPHVDASEPVATHATLVVGIVVIGVLLGGAAIVAARIGAGVIAFRGAQAMIVLLLAGVLIVATTGVRRPSLPLDGFRRVSGLGRRMVSNPIVLSLSSVPLCVLLGWRVDTRFFFLAIILVVVLSSLIGRPTEDRPGTPRKPL